MRTLNSTKYPRLLMQLPDGKRVQFEKGYASVDDDLGALALKHGEAHGIVQVDDVAESRVDPSGEPSTFGRLPANPALPAAASTDVGGPGTTPGATTPVGDDPTVVGEGEGDALPDPLPDDLTDLTLRQLRQVAADRDVALPSTARTKSDIVDLLNAK